MTRQALPIRLTTWPPPSSHHIGCDRADFCGFVDKLLNNASIQQVARRGLINLRVGTDNATGAVVASIARQPPYGRDWPRDGAFFDVALDASGQSALVDKRLDQVVKWQRKDPVKPVALIDTPPPLDPRTGKAEFYPGGAWEMNNYQKNKSFLLQKLALFDPNADVVRPKRLVASALI